MAGNGLAGKRGTGGRRRRGQRGPREAQGRGKLPIAIVAGIVAIALAAIGATTIFVFGGSEDQEHQDHQVATKSLDIAPENAEVGIAVGNKIPDFEIRLNNGNVVSAANLVDQGQPTFYFFFATW